MDIGMMNDVARLKKRSFFHPQKRFNYFQFIFMTTIINTISLQNKFFTKKKSLQNKLLAYRYLIQQTIQNIYTPCYYVK